MNTNELRKWAENHSIESNTIKGFWEMFNNYKEEQKEEFLEVFGADLDKGQLIIKMNRLGLFIDAWNKDAFMQYGFDYVTTYIPIIYKDNQIGEYKMLFNLDGICFDDYFIIF
ncbi:hypothetical protein LZ480_19530 [Solibacillus sp. MA9]|uniref:Uncharacterized protein n=1 Tax=Solibacillus palustris TaxID=2908203 RepID=A0ABS9UJH9_9BACL|nr:hypothetical protein [Solibacillus sp. MA9]MCH7324055.1 hypothetical protein [Solibacillus sp. MA9]